MAEIAITDTCTRCGLKRLTRALDEQRIIIRLCDDCYWGKEPEEKAATAA